MLTKLCSFYILKTFFFRMIQKKIFFFFDLCKVFRKKGKIFLDCPAKKDFFSICKKLHYCIVKMTKKKFTKKILFLFLILGSEGALWEDLLRKYS